MRSAEFYSGVGGMHYALKEALALLGADAAEVVAAFDVNPSANAVYEANFGLKPKSTDVGALSPAQLDELDARTWLLSPPCQPYTRQNARDPAAAVADPRALSFVKLLGHLGDVQRKPDYVIVENVLGFEVSETRALLIATLNDAGYDTQEYLVSPMDVGVPYARSRYFCLAKRRPLRFADPARDGTITAGPPGRAPGADAPPPQPLSAFFVADPGLEDPRRRDEDDPWAAYRLPTHTLERYFQCMDVVTPFSRRCVCFTKAYAKFAKGTGSVLATNAIPEVLLTQGGRDGGKSGGGGEGGVGEAERDGLVRVHLASGSGQIDKADLATMRRLDVRYFTPREVANLHSFPQSFAFPEDVSLKQRYALLGNSLSVRVVAVLLRYLFTEPQFM